MEKVYSKLIQRSRKNVTRCQNVTCDVHGTGQTISGIASFCGKSIENKLLKLRRQTRLAIGAFHAGRDSTSLYTPANATTLSKLSSVRRRLGSDAKRVRTLHVHIWAATHDSSFKSLPFPANRCDGRSVVPRPRWVEVHVQIRR